MFLTIEILLVKPSLYLSRKTVIEARIPELLLLKFWGISPDSTQMPFHNSHFCTTTAPDLVLLTIPSD